MNIVLVKVIGIFAIITAWLIAGLCGFVQNQEIGAFIIGLGGFFMIVPIVLIAFLDD
jgi:hypothetical protein